jgi:tetratricopeptide (TPR) repeat protein
VWRYLSRSACACLLLISAPVARALAETTPATPANPENSAVNPSYQFLIGKLLAGEGAVPEALAAFQEAERLAPDSPYVRIEHAELLARLAQVGRKQAQQSEQLKQAAALVTQARQMAPSNRDVLRAAGAVYVLIAARDGSALESAREAYEAVLEQEPGDAQSALTLGRIYLEQQQPEKAAQVFRDLIERAPQQRNAYALLVEALLQARQGREAETALQQLLALDPESLEARLTLAELQGQRDDHRAALATLLATPESARSDPRFQRQLAWAYYLTGGIDAAQAALAPLRRADADDLQLALLQGLIFSAQGRNAEAAELFVKVRAKRPEDPALTLALARVLERQDKRDEAAAAVSALIAELAKEGKGDEERKARLELAQIYFGAKQWDKVASALAPLLAAPAAPPEAGTRVGGKAADPMAAGRGPTGGSLAAGGGPAAGSSAAGSGPAGSLTAGGGPAAGGETAGGTEAGGKPEVEASRLAAKLLAADTEVQQKSFDQALALLGPGSGSQITGKRAEVLFKAGRDVEARRELDRLAAGGEAEALLAAAQTYQRLEKYADSVPLLERLVAGHRDSAAAGFLLGAAYERTGRREQSVAELRRVLALEPDFHAALNYLGYMFAERGEHLEEARKLIERAVALDPDNGAYVDSLGWVYFRQGQVELARATLERATRLETADATVQEHLGDVYGALGQPERAGDAYRRALALGNNDPGKSEELRRKLDSLSAARRR